MSGVTDTWASGAWARDRITEQVEQVRRRLVAQGLLRGATLGLLAAGLGWLPAWWFGSLWGAGGAALGGILLGLLLGYLRRPSGLTAARAIDRALGLQEQIPTAWERALARDQRPLVGLLWTTTADRLAEAEPELARLRRVRVPWITLLTSLALCVAMLVVLQLRPGGAGSGTLGLLLAQGPTGDATPPAPTGPPTIPAVAPPPTAGSSGPVPGTASPGATSGSAAQISTPGPQPATGSPPGSAADRRPTNGSGPGSADPAAPSVGAGDGVGSGAGGGREKPAVPEPRLSAGPPSGGTELPLPASSGLAGSPGAARRSVLPVPSAALVVAPGASLGGGARSLPVRYTPLVQRYLELATPGSAATGP